MGSAQLTSVMETVGKTMLHLKEEIENQSEAVYSSARIWDDGVIEPQMTRGVLGLGLRAAYGGKTEGKSGERWGVFRM